MDQYPFFVYGTLLAGESNHRLFGETVKDIQDGRITGRLFSLGSFPMVVPGGKMFGDNGLVYGQVVTVKDADYTAVLNRLDRLEGYNPDNHVSSFYQRNLTVVTLEDERQILAWYYFGRAYQVNGRQPIPSGSWKQWLKERGR